MSDRICTNCGGSTATGCWLCNPDMHQQSARIAELKARAKNDADMMKELEAGLREIHIDELETAPAHRFKVTLEVAILELEAQIAKRIALEAVLRDMIDEDDCVLDHNGNCQQHNWFGASECPDARAKALLGDEDDE